MRYVYLVFVLAFGWPSFAAVTCAPRLAPRDLSLEALTAIHQLPEFGKVVWEFALNSSTNVPFVIVVGPDSRRKSEAIKRLLALVPQSRAYDVPTSTPAAVAAGRSEFHVAAWLSEVHLHVLDLSIPRDYKPLDWADLRAASASLTRLGFAEIEIMSTAGVYLIDP